MKQRYSILVSIFVAGILSVPAASAGIVDSPINFFPDGTRGLPTSFRYRA